jgi:hypothetical protein
MSISAQVTTVIGGAIAPLIAIALLGAFDSSIPVAIYVVTVAVITSIGVGLAKETHRRDLATMHDTAG